MQEVYLDGKVKLLDCPGVIFSTDDEKTLVLRNIIKVILFSQN
jgi:ribosome biogenesis GTPase A